VARRIKLSEMILGSPGSIRRKSVESNRTKSIFDLVHIGDRSAFGQDNRCGRARGIHDRWLRAALIMTSRAQASAVDRPFPGMTPGIVSVRGSAMFSVRTSLRITRPA
jgi:hypothetical protein